MFKKSLVFSLISLALLIAIPAYAICPVCTIAVCAGLGIFAKLGIDDLISGAWIGAFIVSTVFWAIEFLDKKQIHFKFRKIIVAVLMYLLILIPLRLKGFLGHPLNKFCGIDKLFFGIGSGSIVFILSLWVDNLLRKKNKRRSFFPFQKVVIPISFLLILSLIFYLIIKG